MTHEYKKRREKRRKDHLLSTAASSCEHYDEAIIFRSLFPAFVGKLPAVTDPYFALYTAWR
jgi:hypothetical protein